VGNSLGNHIVLFDPVEHRDIPDAAFDKLDQSPRIASRRGWRVSLLATPGSFTATLRGPWWPACATPWSPSATWSPSGPLKAPGSRAAKC